MCTRTHTQSVKVLKNSISLRFWVLVHLQDEDDCRSELFLFIKGSCIGMNGGGASGALRELDFGLRRTGSSG